LRRQARTDEEQGSDVPSKEEDGPLYTGLGAARLRGKKGACPSAVDTRWTDD